MELAKQTNTSKAPDDCFTGDVWRDVIHADQGPSRMRVNPARFAPVRCRRVDGSGGTLTVL
ncbi:hypothetical protein AB0H57_21815 [Micromonospora sp. NPDC050686]|uniref:hypothetical protein n=1 Tax=Micromonospora sp. NPDC050686 TaxID=3154631 RepID=UPI0033F55499